MNISPISFTKLYKGKSAVINKKTGEKEALDFVEYEPEKDYDFVGKQAKKWRETSKYSGLIGAIARGMNFNRGKTYLKYYGLEDKKGDIQAICQIMPYKTNNTIEIDSLEVNPKSMYGGKNREYSKLGTSLFKEIVKLAKERNAIYINLTDFSGGFWDKMPYLQTSKYDNSKMKLFNKDYDKCILEIDI